MHDGFVARPRRVVGLSFFGGYYLLYFWIKLKSNKVSKLKPLVGAVKLLMEKIKKITKKKKNKRKKEEGIKLKRVRTNNIK